jgi:hypothetical protein
MANPAALRAEFLSLRQEYLNKLEDLTVKPFITPIKGEPTVSDQHFVLTKQLKTWMTEIPPGSKHSIGKRLLYKTYWAGGHDLPPLEVDYALNTCVLVFCILLELDCAYLLHEFVRYGLRDSKFPKDDIALEQSLKKMGYLKQDDMSKLSGFGDTQWKYFPAHLERDMDIVWSLKRRLPFCDRQPLSDKG